MDYEELRLLIWTSKDIHDASESIKNILGSLEKRINKSNCFSVSNLKDISTRLTDIMNDVNKLIGEEATDLMCKRNINLG